MSNTNIKSNVYTILIGIQPNFNSQKYCDSSVVYMYSVSICVFIKNHMMMAHLGKNMLCADYQNHLFVRWQPSILMQPFNCYVTFQYLLVRRTKAERSIGILTIHI
jgi:hypothetical protein